jgi:hypothetical protein
MGRSCGTQGEEESRILIGKPEGKRPLGRLRCRLENDIKTDLRGTGLD